MSVVDVIRRRYEDVTLTRRTGQTIASGIVSDTAQDVSVIQAHVQQANSSDMESLPEGQRTQDWRVVWSETTLQDADLLTIDAVVYKVMTVEFWDQGPFYKAMATIVDDTPP